MYFFMIFRYGEMALIVAFDGDWTAEKAALAHAAARKSHPNIPLIADASWAASTITVDAEDMNARFTPDWPAPSYLSLPYSSRWKFRITHDGFSHSCEDFSSYIIVDQRTKETA